MLKLRLVPFGTILDLLLHTIVKRCRVGLVLKAHRLFKHSTIVSLDTPQLGSNKEEDEESFSAFAIEIRSKLDLDHILGPEPQIRRCYQRNMAMSMLG